MLTTPNQALLTHAELDRLTRISGDPCNHTVIHRHEIQKLCRMALVGYRALTENQARCYVLKWKSDGTYWNGRGWAADRSVAIRFATRVAALTKAWTYTKGSVRVVRLVPKAAKTEPEEVRWAIRGMHHDFWTHEGPFQQQCWGPFSKAHFFTTQKEAQERADLWGKSRGSNGQRFATVVRVRKGQQP